MQEPARSPLGARGDNFATPTQRLWPQAPPFIQKLPASPQRTFQASRAKVRRNIETHKRGWALAGPPASWVRSTGVTSRRRVTRGSICVPQHPLCLIATWIVHVSFRFVVMPTSPLGHANTSDSPQSSPPVHLNLTCPSPNPRDPLHRLRHVPIAIPRSPRSVPLVASRSATVSPLSP